LIQQGNWILMILKKERIKLKLFYSLVILYEIPVAFQPRLFGIIGK
jgi:hypothetical protein